MTFLLASIPSPHSGVFHIFGRPIHLYGLMLLLAIVAAIWLTWVRWKRLGGDPDLVLRVAVWGVAAGIVGARAYHDITSWSEVPDQWWGRSRSGRAGSASGAGSSSAAWSGRDRPPRRRQCFLVRGRSCPGLLLAQGIGRWGNYFNQELYGKPTSLPWGLKIDFAHRVPKYLGNTTFHPTFLYEFIYDLIGVGILLSVGSRFRIRPPALFALYVSYYCFGRFFEELLRVDPSRHFSACGPTRGSRSSSSCSRPASSSGGSSSGRAPLGGERRKLRAARARRRTAARPRPRAATRDPRRSLSEPRRRPRPPRLVRPAALHRES